MSYNRHEFLDFFYHPLVKLFDGVEKINYNILEEDALWERTIVHHREFGVCHTYNPPKESFASADFGIR